MQLPPSHALNRRKTRTPSLCLALAGLLYALAVAAAPATSPKVPDRSRTLEPREIAYLEKALAKIRRMRGNMGWIGSQPMGAGALASAALAATGRPDAAALRAETAGYVRAALDGCRNKWGKNECARAELPLQRVALQYPKGLEPALLERLRAEVGQGLRPPGPAMIERPWSFPDTENQRMIATARALIAEVVAGRAAGPAAGEWGRFAAAFLRAHDRDGWYEAESPGYLILSITSLLHLADLAPQAEVRGLARRNLDVLFARWALSQVGGFPAGPKSRTYSFWALSDRSSAWLAWYWLLTGTGDTEGINFMDRPELPVSLYRVPDGVVELLKSRRTLAPYEIRERRQIIPEKRRRLDAFLYTWATPDYILGVAQSISSLALRVSGGQEIAATLFPEAPAGERSFAPLYLWSRTRDPHDDEDADWSTDDQAAGDRNAAVARLGKAGLDLGHAYLSPGWSQPEAVRGAEGAVLVSRRGDTYVALVTAGGWEDPSPAIARFPKYYGRGKQAARDEAGAWAAVARRQPASIGLLVGRAREDGDFTAWRRKVAALRLEVQGAPAGAIRLRGAGIDLRFLPGREASSQGKAIATPPPASFSSPLLRHLEDNSWKLEVGGQSLTLANPNRGGERQR